MNHSELLAPGDLFEDRYEIVAKLGDGGFGIVYKARQLTTGQYVAIKLMRHSEHGYHGLEEKRAARFRREMQLCAQLYHPHIVQLLDSGQTDAGLLYTVFAFAPGEHLADVLAQEGALDLAEVKHLMLQVLDALACAHAQDVIHRDLKPHNIMVLPTGARRNALVLDFGIGTLTTTVPGQALLPLTGTNEILGTPGYAAPEQLRGRSISPRSDLFSWGLIVIECLTGKRVYTGETMADVLGAQLSADPVPIPRMLMRHPIGALLRRVTHKEVAARMGSIASIFDEFDRACRSGPLHGSPLANGASFAVSEQGEGSGFTQGDTVAISSPNRRSRMASPVMSAGERRQITALCCSISGRADGAGRLDIENDDALVRTKLDTCAEIAYRHGGHLVTALGDQMLVYFGYPRAMENDASRAARAALTMASMIQAENQERAAAQGARLELRLGIHTGLVVSTEQRRRRGVPARAGVGVGSTSRIASWLVRYAQPGVILVTEEAQRLLRTSFDLDAESVPRPAHGIHDNGEQMRVYRLRQEQDIRPTSDSAGTPLVGRAHEMEILLVRWNRAKRGDGQCILLTGEPGIGKSRLGRELRHRISGEIHLCLDIRCSPETQHNSLHPIIELLRRVLGLSYEVSPEGKIAWLESQLSGYGFDAMSAMPIFLPLLSLPIPAPYAALDVSPPRHKELTRDAIVSLFFAMAETKPVLFLVEDLHWADASTIELLAHLVREAPSAPMYVLLTARPEPIPSFPTAGILQLHLSRLERAQVEAMANNLLGKKTLPAALLEQIVDRTDGIPLFVEELIRMMVESGLLIEHEERYELARELSHTEIPSTLRALLMARLDRLGRAKETAQLAAALGREFTLALLLAVSRDDPATVQKDLDELLGAGLLYQKRRFKERVYLFKHALIRDAAYESLPRVTRATVHAMIAATIEERFPEMLESRPDLLAHHHAAAEQKRQAIGYAQRAAMSALQRAAIAEAIVHGRQALSWLDAIDDLRERAEVELAVHGVLTPALMSAEGYAAPSVGNAHARARELCESLGASAQLFPVLWGLGAYYAVRADLRNAVEMGQRALAVAEAKGEPTLLIPAYLLVGGTQLWLGDFDAARTHLTWGSQLYDADTHGDLASIYSYDPGIATRSYLALTQWFLGYPEQAASSAHTAAKLATMRDHCHTSIHTLVRATQLQLLFRDGATGLGQAEHIIALSGEKGFLLWKAMGTFLRGWALSELGRMDEGIENMCEGIHGWAGTGADVHRAWFSTVLADAYCRAARAEDGLRAVDEALGYCRSTHDCLFEAEAYRVKAELLLLSETGDHGKDQAEECLARALDTARMQRAKMLELRAAMSAARLWKRFGKAEEARRVLGIVYASFKEGFDTSDLLEANALLQGL
jgi:TOMM system kinase/cyclase fusion protein